MSESNSTAGNRSLLENRRVRYGGIILALLVVGLLVGAFSGALGGQIGGPNPIFEWPF